MSVPVWHRRAAFIRVGGGGFLPAGLAGRCAARLRLMRICRVSEAYRQIFDVHGA